MEKVTGAQLTKQFPVFYRTGRFVIAFTQLYHTPDPELDESSPCPHNTST